MPHSFTYNGTTYYYITNLQGDVIEIRDGSNALVGSYVYNAYGKIISMSGSMAEINPLRYRGYYYDSESGLYYLNSRYYDPEIGRFINADGLIDTNDFHGYNLFAYCGNNPVNRIDPLGDSWGHWIAAAAIVAVAAVAVIVTAGGAAAALVAVASEANGLAAATTASTIAAGAFVGASMVLGTAVLTASEASGSLKEFADQGNWGTVAATAGGAVLGGASAAASTKSSSKTTVYRSVSAAEAKDIKATGQFNLATGGMESKQFGFNLSETRHFGNMMGQSSIVSARVPTNMLGSFYTGGVDTSIFRSGTITVYGDQLGAFNQAVGGTIKFMP